MKKATCKLSSASPYSQGKYHSTPKKDRELAKDYEERTWREKLHTDEDGNVFIPPTAFKNCLSECAKYMSIQIPGKGKATYTKHFEAGVLVTDPVFIGVKKEDVAHQVLFVPSDGQRGGGKRVEKFFTLIPEWAAEVTFLIFDEIITEDVFTNMLEKAGQFIGIGVFRPRNNGYYGRFEIENIEWS